KQQAALRPGDRSVLARLHAAAVDDHDAVFTRAIEHVLRAFDRDAEPLHAPPLALQPEAPQLLQALLFRTTTMRFHEALLHAWDTGIFRKELAHYDLNGTERFLPNTPLGQAYADVIRQLGAFRTNLFHIRSAEPLEGRVALLQPPAFIVSGEPTDQDPSELL